MTLRALFAIALLLLAACGGGGSSPAPAAAPSIIASSFYADSASSGDYFDPPGVLRRQVPSPVELVSQAGPVRCQSYAVDGLQLAELLRGGRVALGVSITGPADMVVVGSFADRLQQDPAPIIVIGVGMVDVIFTAIALPEYLQLVRQAVATVRAAGKRPVLRGFNRFAPSDLFTLAMQARLQAFDQALQAEAAQLGVRYLDVASAGEPEMSPDQLHASSAYNRRIAEVIAAGLAAEAWAMGQPTD